jgi:hypothetical protein
MVPRLLVIEAAQPAVSSIVRSMPGESRVHGIDELHGEFPETGLLCRTREPEPSAGCEGVSPQISLRRPSRHESGSLREPVQKINGVIEPPVWHVDAACKPGANRSDWVAGSSLAAAPSRPSETRKSAVQFQCDGRLEQQRRRART